MEEETGKDDLGGGLPAYREAGEGIGLSGQGLWMGPGAWSQLPAPLALPHSASSHPHTLQRLVQGLPGGGDGCWPPERPPQVLPHLPGVAGPSPGGGRQWPGHPAPASSQVTWAVGSVVTAVTAGGCQHPRRRGAPAQAPTLLPSQGPDLGLWWRGGSRRRSRNLRGASSGSRGPSLLFHKPGPSQEQCRT